MSALRLSAPDWCFLAPGADSQRYYEALAALGIEGAEMVAPERFGAARAAGLTIVNLSAPGMTRGLNRVEHHAALLPRIEATIRLAGSESIGHVIVFSGNRAGQPDAEGIDNVARGIEGLLPVAASCRVVLLLEMLNTFDHADYQASSSAYGAALLERVGSSSLRLLYDVYHMSRMGEDVVADLSAKVDAIAHVHVAEAPDRSTPRRDGVVPLEAVCRTLAAHGYRGYLGLEYVPSGDPLADLARAVAAVRAID